VKHGYLVVSLILRQTGENLWLMSGKPNFEICLWSGSGS